LTTARRTEAIVCRKNEKSVGASMLRDCLLKCECGLALAFASNFIRTDDVSEFASIWMTCAYPTSCPARND
jgi:hypothetical protein